MIRSLIFAAMAVGVSGTLHYRSMEPDTSSATCGNPASCANPDPSLISGNFPSNFIWAAATAAFQIEGGWNASNKGPSIWDHMCHQKPDPCAKNASGDVACDSYDLWQQDIKNLQAMGLKYYRLSISWPRILPTGLVKDGVNLDGIRYYAGLLKGLQNAGITPMVTLYHWDLPEMLQNGTSESGGWMNPKLSDHFQDYATLCYTLFGKYVKYWITFNEPWVVSWLGYGAGPFAPQINYCPGTCPYLATHTILLSHAKAYHAYAPFRASQGGQVGMTMNCDYKSPATNSPADIAATERAMQFQLGWFANAIYGSGDYPDIMKWKVGNRSIAEGLPTSRLPVFSQQEIAFIKGSYDFFGINMYTTFLVSNAPNTNGPSYGDDQEAYACQCSNWMTSGSSWLKFTPWGARGLLNWIANHYGNPPIIVTENGWSDKNGTTYDPYRANYYKYYINNILKEYYASVVAANGFNPCTLYSPCANGGVCSPTNGNSDYNCACPTGWSGKNCTMNACSVTIYNQGGQSVSVQYQGQSGPSSMSVSPFQQGSTNAVMGSTIYFHELGGSYTTDSCVLGNTVCAQGAQVTCFENSYAFGCICQ